MIEPMVKIEIAGLMENLDETLEILQRLGTVEIIEIPTIEDSSFGSVHRIHLDQKREDLLSSYTELSATTAELLEILRIDECSLPSLDDEKIEELSALSTDTLSKQIAKVARSIRRQGRRRRSLEEDLESMRQYETLIGAFLPLLEQAGQVAGKEQIGIILKKNESAVLSLLKDRINDITGPDSYVLHREMPDNSIGVYMVIAPEDLLAVRELLGNEGVAEYHLPRELRRDSLRESIELIRDNIENIPSELKEVDKKIEKERLEHGAFLRYVHTYSIDRINQLRILSKLVRTRYTFIVSGWTPASTFSTLTKTLTERYGESVNVSKVRISDIDMLSIPTQTNNIGILRPFQVLMKLLPPPKYDNLDATPFISFFFPLFFGIILGDIAYGLLLMAIAIGIKIKAPRGIVRDIGSVALAGAICTILFGFLYGEFLGDLGEVRFGMHPVVPWLHRAHAMQTILLLSIGIGIIHIMLGFILKLYISVVIGHRKGIIESVSKMGVIASVIAIFLQLLLNLPAAVMYGAIAVILTSFVGIVYTEGFFGLLETLTMLGNILSYSRIMAVGLASVILALVANRLAEASHNIFLAVIIGLFIHGINFVMGVFSPSIHSLRLHYVEFFTKFFNSSGRPFQPFRRVDCS